MHHPTPVSDEAYLVQAAAELLRQRNELDRLRRAVEAAGGSHSNREPRHAAAKPFQTNRQSRALSPRSPAS